MVNEVPSENKREHADSEDASTQQPRAIAETLTASANSKKPNKYKQATKKHLHVAYKWMRFTFLPRHLVPVAKSSSLWTAAATIVIAIATVFYTHYARKEWEVTARQLNDFEAVERATIVLQPFEAVWEDKPDAPIQIQCMIWNTGQTTARAISINYGQGGGGPIPNDRNGNPTLPSIFLGRFPEPSDYGPSLAPNEKRDCSWIHQFTAGDAEYVAQVRAGKVVQEFSIQIGYRDVFGKAWGLNDCLIYYARKHHFNHCDIKTR
jgi:hypothetical protein